MHKIGIQSTGTVRQENIDEGYRIIKAAGFDCVDFNFDEYLNVNDVRAGKIHDFFDRPIEEMWKDFEPHVQAAARYGLTFEQMHAPFPMMLPGQEAINEKMCRITLNCMELGARMGGRYIVVHPATLAYEYGRQDEHDFNICMYRKLIPAAKRLGLVVCLENMFVEQNGHLTEGACSDFHEAACIIDELNELAGKELFGFCFDIGHANILGKNMYQSVVFLGHRLKTLHLHDNDGMGDLHNMPFTFARGWNPVATDWKGFLRGLKEIRYQGVINFETFRCMQGFPVELHPSLLKLQADMGRYFSDQI